MKIKHSLLVFLFLISICIKSQKADSLTIYYYENYPYSYSESGKLKGIEVDIIDEYIFWLKEKKGLVLTLTTKPFKEFSAFYNATKTGNSKVIGIGSVTNNSEREIDVQFSPPYLQNLALLITDGKVPTVKSKSAVDVSSTLLGLSAIVVKNSSHINYLNDIKKLFVPELKISFADSQNEVLEKISVDKKTFGYVDVVAYWAYLKKNPNTFLKIQKVFNEPKENFSFVMPKNSVHAAYINEFFETGFGFTSTKRYRQILEKYLGYEIIEAVEIK